MYPSVVPLPADTAFSHNTEKAPQENPATRGYSGLGVHPTSLPMRQWEREALPALPQHGPHPCRPGLDACRGSGRTAGQGLQEKGEGGDEAPGRSVGRPLSTGIAWDSSGRPWPWTHCQRNDHPLERRASCLCGRGCLQETDMDTEGTAEWWVSPPP